MIQEFAQKWSAALRSEQYTQGFGTMRKGDLFCALGVLVDAVAPELWARNNFGEWAHDGHHTGLSSKTAAMLGMLPAHMIDGYSIYHPVIQGMPVAHLNDKNRKNFAEIADMVDEHWETI